MLALTPSRYHLAVIAMEAAEARYDAALDLAFGAENAAAARIGFSGIGEPGTALRAAFDAWRDARDELANAEADRPGADEFRGYRPARRHATLPARSAGARL